MKKGRRKNLRLCVKKKKKKKDGQLSCFSPYLSEEEEQVEMVRKEGKGGEEDIIFTFSTKGKRPLGAVRAEKKGRHEGRMVGKSELARFFLRRKEKDDL